MTDDEIVEAMAKAMMTDQFRRIMTASGMEWQDGHFVLAQSFAQLAFAVARPMIEAAAEPVAWMIVAPGCKVGPVETMASVALHKLVHGSHAPGTALVPLYARAALGATDER